MARVGRAEFIAAELDGRTFADADERRTAAGRAAAEYERRCRAAEAEAVQRVGARVRYLDPDDAAPGDGVYGGVYTVALVVTVAGPYWTGTEYVTRTCPNGRVVLAEIPGISVRADALELAE